MRGLRRNQISTPDYIYQNDRFNKINTLNDFYNETSTHSGAAHAISKTYQKFQNRIPRELVKTFDIPRTGMIH